MPNIEQAKKRVRQDQVRNLRNRTRKSAMKTQVKKVMTAIESLDVEAAETEMRVAEKIIKKLGAKNIIHHKNADRKTSRLAKKVHDLKVKVAKG